MGVSWLDYKGKKILYVDYRGQTLSEDFQTLETQAQILSALETKCLVLTNYEGTHATSEYMQRVKELGRTVFNQKIARSALLGISGIKEVLLRGYMAFTAHKNVEVFKSEAEALEWLVQ